MNVMSTCTIWSLARELDGIVTDKQIPFQEEEEEKGKIINRHQIKNLWMPWVWHACLHALNLGPRNFICINLARHIFS